MDADIISMILNISSKEQLCQFIHNTVDEQIGKPFTSVGHVNNDVDWPEENQAAARKYFQNIFHNRIMDDDYDISEKLSELGTEKIKIIEDCFQIRKPEIMQMLKNELLAKKDDPVCTGFDWKVKWIIGSSALSSIREPVAQVDLQTLNINQKEHIKNTVKFEMNTTELDSFISQLQKAVSEAKGSQ